MKQWIFSLTILLLSLQMLAAQPRDQEAYYAGVKQGWRYMQLVYERLNKQYVEDIEPYEIIRAGINGMLDELDPYTVFLEEEGDRRLRIMTTGKYGGLGMEIGLRNNQVTVIAPISDSPAQRMGVMAGDIIVKVDSVEITDMNVEQVSRLLRGKIGTDVRLHIRRPGVREPFELVLTRAEIVLQDVGYAGFMEPGVAYVAINAFTDKVYDELRAAFLDLQKKQKIEAVVLDLRGNPGGLLESAVNVVNLFVPKEQLVVYTKGFREKEYRFYTQNEPLLPKVPLAVLVDNGSASASEIVAGALQDLDRAVVIGEPTFGKGLVQKVFPIDKHKNVKLKMTTAKYYIPSGRCIQKKDYGRNNRVIHHDSKDVVDPGSKAFYTANKRKVFDKGGIYPDVQVASDSLSNLLTQLLRSSMIFDFSVMFRQQNPDLDIEHANVDSLMRSFRSYLDQKNFRYNCSCKKDLDHIAQIIESEHKSEAARQLLADLRQALQNNLDHEFEENYKQIARYLYLDLIGKYLDRENRIKISLKDDKQALEALHVLKNRQTYQQILVLE